MASKLNAVQPAARDTGRSLSPGPIPPLLKQSSKALKTLHKTLVHEPGTKAAASFSKSMHKSRRAPKVQERERRWQTLRDYSKEEEQRPLNADVAPDIFKADELMYDKNVILFGFSIYFVNDVDAMKQQFSCDFNLHMQWLDPHYDDYPDEWGSKEEFIEYVDGAAMVWVPKARKSEEELDRTLSASKAQQAEQKHAIPAHLR